MSEDSLVTEIESKRSVRVTAKASEVKEGPLAGYQYKMDISVHALPMSTLSVGSLKAEVCFFCGQTRAPRFSK
jgi:hypothetical protein